MKKALIAIAVISSIALGAIVYLTINVNSRAVSEFPASGYILDTDTESGKASYNQIYFNGGERFTRSSSTDSYSFKTIDGDKVSVSKASYIHYNDDSLQAMTKTVIFDTDDTDQAALSYIAVPLESMLQKSGDDYIVTNPDGTASSFRNFVWKISDNDYMVVSEEVKLFVGEEEKQTFPDYVQVKYKDSGIALLTTQQGVYSTVSSDAYLELANGVRIYLGSKNVSTGEAGGIVCNLTQLVVNASEDTVELAPDEEYNNENTTQPQLIVDASDGEDGEEGDPGEAGEAGEAGKNGARGEDGEEGEDGEQGDDGETGQAGKSGEAGKNGVNGNNGTNGNPGATGSGGTAGEEGDEGTEGDNASTAYLVFTTEKYPEFHASVQTSMTQDGQFQAISGTSDEVLVWVSYEDEDATWGFDEDSLKFTIYETETGSVAAEKKRSNIPTSIQGSGFYVDFSGLKPATNYTLIISANLEDGKGNVIPRDLVTQYFVTESVGVTLTTRYVTSSSADFYLKRTSDDPITHVCINLFDSEKNRLEKAEGVNTTFLVPKDGVPDDAGISPTEDYYLYNCENGRFSTEQLCIPLKEDDTKSGKNKGEYTIDQMEVIAGIYDYTNKTLSMGAVKDSSGKENYPLDSDTVYYAQIVAYEETDNVYSELSEYSFPMVRFKTLRKTPEIESPVIKLSGYENAFIISARNVSDPDNGIVSYRYEVYQKDETTGKYSDEPVYTTTSQTATSVKVPIDGKSISIGKTYKAKLIAQFNNNEVTIDVPSELSTEFILSTALPKVVAETPVITASTISGTVKVTDVSKLLQCGKTNYIRVLLVPQQDLLTGKDGEKYSDKYGYSTDYSGLMTPVEVGNIAVTDSDNFTISYYAQGLKEGTFYDLYVYADYCMNPTNYTDGKMTEESHYRLALPVTYQTAAYTSLVLNAVKGTPTQADSRDASTTPAFKYYVYFTSGDQTKDDDNKSVSLGDTSGNNVGHFSSKSMEFVKFELYLNDTLVGRFAVDGSAAYTDAEDYDFGKIKDVIRNKAEDPKGDTYQLYLETGEKPLISDGSGGTTGSVTETQCKDDGLGIPIVSDSFEDVRQGHSGPLQFGTLGYNQGDNLEIRAVVYDYTYRDGSTSNVSWQYFDSEAKQSTYKYCNGITVTDTFEFQIDTQAPDFDTIQGQSYTANPIEKQDVVYSSGSYYGKIDSTNSNYSFYTGTDLKTDVWESTEMFDDTTIGLLVNGPDCSHCNLIDYVYDKNDSLCGSVRYTVYTQITTTGTKEHKLSVGEPVADSGWIKVTSKDEFPDWYFLIDATNETVKRGQKFYIKTEVKLNNQYEAKVVVDGNTYYSKGRIYPTDFIDSKISTSDEVNRAFHDTFFKDVDGEIIQTFCYDKQKPDFSIVPWQGTLTLSGTDTETYLVSLNDLDEALTASGTYTDYKQHYGNVLFYEGSPSEQTVDGTLLTERLEENNLTSTKNFAYQLAGITRTNRATNMLKYRYKLNEDSAEKAGLLDVSAEYVIQGGGTSIVTSTSGELTMAEIKTVDSTQTDYLDFKYSNGQATLKFWFKDEDGGNGLKRADMKLVFHNESDTKPISFEFKNITLTAGGDITKQGKKYYQKIADVAILDTLNSKIKDISGKTHLTVSITGYSDSGNYGLYYADGSGSTLTYTLQEKTAKEYCDMSGTNVEMGKAIYTTKSGLVYNDLATRDANGKITLSYNGSSTGKTVEYKDGVSMIPRQVSCQSLEKKDIDNPFKTNSTPSYEATRKAGLTEVSVTLEYYLAGVKSTGNLTHDANGKMIHVVYKKADGTGSEQEYYLTDDATSFPSMKTIRETVTVDELERDTTYLFKVYGYDGTSWVLLTNRAYDSTTGETSKDFRVKTLAAVPIEIQSVFYQALESAENAKKAIATIKIGTDTQLISKADINLSVKHAYLRIMDEAGNQLHESSDLLTTMQNAFADGNKATKTIEVQMNWAPDEKCLMNGTTKYSYEFYIEYNNSTKGLEKTGNSLVSTPEKWNNVNNVRANENRASYFLPTMTVGYESGHKSSNGDYGGTVSVAIDGYDELRLYRELNTFPAASGDITTTAGSNMTYWVELYKKVSTNNVISEQFVERKYVTKAINPSGEYKGSITFVNASECTFTGLKTGEEYKVKVVAFWDNDNDGAITVKGSGSEWTMDLENTECDMEETSWTEVLSDYMEIKAISFNIGTDSNVRVQGENLSKITKIIYHLEINGVSVGDGGDWTLEKDVPADSSKQYVSWDNWTEDKKQSGSYLLSIPGMTSTDSRYKLVVTFYYQGGSVTKQVIYTKNKE